MSPFQRSYYPEEAFDMERHMRDFGLNRPDAEQQVKRMREERVYRNDTYQVAVSDAGDLWHLSIKRIDRECIHDWRDLQEIKNEIVGPYHEGMELYPSESRLVDMANQYHLWVFKDSAVRVPFGFGVRMVTESPGGEAKQRPFPKKEPQR